MSLTPSPALLSELAKPSAVYTRRAWLAMGGLAVFMLLYLLLAAWFVFTAYRLTLGVGDLSQTNFIGWIMAVCALILAAFMIKGFFFVQRGGNDDSLEITAQDQPKLFDFLYTLADAAGAPRPHRVFLSARVNAAVFYDLSILNLIFPSKKNLEIGLGLVNVLNLGEFRAVLAHEFGHFAQRAMAVGRWVYIAQQIASNLVARRDGWDEFLKAWARLDFRIAWVSWLLSLVVWSIRSVVDTAFSLVVMVQRALSREMEMQADLVAVSLTGSDALIHALHKLQAADDSWDRAVGFAFDEKAKDNIAPDVFALQTYMMKRMAALLNDATYGEIPPLPQDKPESHRIFQAELARPPKMWLTHPLNHEREANAKQRYVAAQIDEASAWEIFDQAQTLREKVTTNLLSVGEVARAATDELTRTLDKQFDVEHLKSCYRGVYYGRSPVRAVNNYVDLYAAQGSTSADDIAKLYPETLTQDIEKRSQLEKELAQLQALEAGRLQLHGKKINLRGREIKRRDLPQTIREVAQELAGAEGILMEHDRLCRSAHMAAAIALGNGWPEYMRGILSAIHYAEHTAANLHDARGLLSNTVQIATATSKVSDASIQHILRHANDLQRALQQVFDEANQLNLDNILRQRLGVTTWPEALGEFKLGPMNRENINEWLNVIDGWVNQTAGACSALKGHALEQLLVCEAVLAKHVQKGTQIIPAPKPPTVPDSYACLLPGRERKRQTSLGPWAQFQTASGFFPALARFSVAGGIVVAVLGFGGRVGDVNVTVYNGLSRRVEVALAGHTVTLEPFASTEVQLEPNKLLVLSAKTGSGELIETFKVDASRAFTHFVYNVAGASPLVEWTSVYGNGTARPERLLGAPRWLSSSADVLFTDPPKTVSTKSGGATREVLTGFGNESASQQLALVKDPVQLKQLIASHARWDNGDSSEFLQWLAMAESDPDFPQLLSARLKETPKDVLLLRTQENIASDEAKPALCAQLAQRASSDRDNSDLHYVSDRCGSDRAVQKQAYLEGHQRWPESAWYSYAAGYVEAEAGHWQSSLDAFEKAKRKLPAMKEIVSFEQLRISRFLQQDTPQRRKELVDGERRLQMMLAMESDEKIDSPAIRAYQALHRGQLEKALDAVHEVPDMQAGILRLAAASVGASDKLLARASALPPEQGIDANTAWSAIGLALRSKHDFEQYLKAVPGLTPEMTSSYRQFIAKIQAKDFAAAEQALDGLSPEYRGHAYSLAVVALGEKAPKPWRESAKRLLFVSERPYLG